MTDTGYRPDADPVFIMGCQRSGTTLVSQILGSHPNVAIYHESFFYHILHSELRYYGDLDQEKNLHRFVKDVAGVVGRQARELNTSGETFTPQAEEILAHLKTRDFPGVMSAVLELYARAQGKTRYGEKTPANYQYLRSIRRDFPDSPVFFVFRDPRDSILSGQKILGSGLEQGARMWNDAYHSYARSGVNVKPVCYEKLVTQPRQVIQELCDYINEPYSDSLLSFFRHIPADFLARRKKVALVGSPISDSSIGKFREMKPADIQLIEAWCAEGMKALGYEPEQPPLKGIQIPQRSGVMTRIGFYLDRLRYYGINAERWRHGWIRWKVMLGLRRDYYLSRLTPFRRKEKS